MKIKDVGGGGVISVSDKIKELEKKSQFQKEIYSNLNGWQKFKLSRHPERPIRWPYRTKCSHLLNFIGDVVFGDDKAIIGGLGRINGQTMIIVLVIKGINTKLREVPRQFPGWPIQKGIAKRSV
ncbi:MAG: hypothetical protein IPL23_20095 [Saprospiraceae bacterium]|nr:hypothetical protein [Saprospiraceae bacterium]